LDTAVELHKNGQLDRAEMAYRKLLQEKPSSVPALYGLGQLLSSHRRVDEATELFTSITKLRPSSQKAWLRLSSCHEARGQHMEAELARNRAQKLKKAQLV
jgi:tetratricopeptide (TPR) repeat protein